MVNTGHESTQKLHILTLSFKRITPNSTITMQFAKIINSEPRDIEKNTQIENLQFSRLVPLSHPIFECHKILASKKYFWQHDITKTDVPSF